MANVLVIRPPGRGPGEPNAKMLYLCAFLSRIPGTEVRSRDYFLSRYSKESLEETLRKYSPKTVLIFSEVSCRRLGEIAGIAKGSGATVALCGPLANISPEEAMKSSGADLCLVGDQFSLAKRALSLGKLRGSGRNRIVRSMRPGPPGVGRRDFPFLDRKSPLFGEISPPSKGRGTATILASFGCPFGCSFCVSPAFYGNKWRARNVESVLDEIENAVGAGFSRISFGDDTFGLEEKWLADFCAGVSRRGLSGKFSWEFSTRPDLVTKKGVLLAKNAGCEKVSVGIESGNAGVMRLASKGIPLRKIRSAFSAAKNAGLRTEAIVLLGLPGETEKTLRDTERLLQEISPDGVSAGIFYPFPGISEEYLAKRTLLGKGAIESFRRRLVAKSALNPKRLLSWLKPRGK